MTEGQKIPKKLAAPKLDQGHLRGRLPILALLALCLLVGLMVLPDYGASWDEPNLRLYAAAALKAYSPAARLDPAFRIEDTYGPTNHRFYGPAYVMAASLLVSALRSNPFGWNTDNLWHLASFLTFLASVYALWALCRRMMSPAAALAAATLYLSQPLLWGHALINPKDIPFMASFLIAITSGLAMVDQAAQFPPPSRAGKSFFWSFWTPLASKNSVKLGSPPFSGRRAEGGGGEAATRSGVKPTGTSASIRVLILAAALGLYALLFLSIAAQPLQVLLRLAITAAQSSPAGLLGQLFYRFAASAAIIPAEDYVQKIMHWVNVLRWGAGLFSLIALLIAVMIHPRTGIRAQIKLLIGHASTVRSPRVLLSVFLAALALGLSTSIRLLGPLAGLFVAVYALDRLRARALPLLAAYGLAALGVCFFSWPFLWTDPLRNFSAALSLMANFPDPSQVRFNGEFFVSLHLPALFLPIMVGITLTEPAILLTLSGIVAAGIQLFRRGTAAPRTLIALMLAYLLLPVAAWMVWRPPLYDNGRQYLFVFPAAFVFCGLAIEAIFFILQKSWLRGRAKLQWIVPLALTVLVLLPGLTAGVKIHPYQYAYYNAFVGGQAGAFRRFEVDYWLTSYKEAARYLNATAPNGASIVIFGSVPQLRLYTNPSFQIQKYQAGNPYDADYALLSTRADSDLNLFPAGKVVFTVGRDGAVYAVLKKLK